jgi:hypothetical protein
MRFKNFKKFSFQRVKKQRQPFFDCLCWELKTDSLTLVTLFDGRFNLQSDKFPFLAFGNIF